MAVENGSWFWGNDTSSFPAAVAAARKADVALLFLGLHPQWFDDPTPYGDATEGEGWDRRNITLAPIQQQLVKV